MCISLRGVAVLSLLPCPILVIVLLEHIHCSHVIAVSGSASITNSSPSFLMIPQAFSQPGCPRCSCHSCFVEVPGFVSVDSRHSSIPLNGCVDVVIAASCHVSPRNSSSPRSLLFDILNCVPSARCICPPVLSRITRAPSSIRELVDNLIH